jgi:hypothetical protein
VSGTGDYVTVDCFDRIERGRVGTGGLWCRRVYMAQLKAAYFASRSVCVCISLMARQNSRFAKLGGHLGRRRHGAGHHGYRVRH